MQSPADVIRSDFLERVRAPRWWAFVALRASRLGVAVALVVAPALIVLFLALGNPWGTGDALTEPRTVRDFFSRFLSAIATSSAIGVSVAIFSFRREASGIAAIRAHYRDDLDFRDRAREARGARAEPLFLGHFLDVRLAAVADAARRARDEAGERHADFADEGVTLSEFTGAVVHAVARTRRTLAKSDQDPARVILAAMSLEQEASTAIARRLARHADLPRNVRDALGDLEERIADVIVTAHYVKTLDLQWGLSRMTIGILVTILPALAAASLMGLAFPQGAAEAFGRAGAGALVAAALAVVLLPLGVFVSYLARYVFVNQYSVPTVGFVMGPEEPAIEDLERRTGFGSSTR